ncbi:hypothetical protein TNCV_1601801 [Trichonephila clavipes]|nr:hypothetical protein TNCV_1601801 [Trichonephila clavipes]
MANSVKEQKVQVGKYNREFQILRTEKHDFVLVKATKRKLIIFVSNLLFVNYRYAPPKGLLGSYGGTSHSLRELLDYSKLFAYIRRFRALDIISMELKSREQVGPSSKSTLLEAEQLAILSLQ